MEVFLFYLFAGCALASGLMVVANPFSRSPVTSAMCLVLTILSLAGLFILLHAFFLAATQLIVYAGAVMVLFLFVVMSLKEQSAGPRRLPWIRGTLAILAATGLAWLLIQAVITVPALAPVAPAVDGAAAPLGRKLFADFLLPFEMVSVVLLVAMLGAILLSQKEGK
jgi:NADH-quinone oxidoreductase subunit J